MRDTFKLPLMLAVISAACGAMLVFVGGRTATARSASEQRRIAGSVEKLFGAAAGKARFERIDDLDAFAVVGGESGAEFLGAAVFGRSAHGYAGGITLLAAFGADGRLVDFDVVSAQETPGLGAKIARPEFRRGLAGRRFDAAWKLSKDGGDIDAVTSATISSRAAVEAVADAASRFPAVKGRYAAAGGK